MKNKIIYSALVGTTTYLLLSIFGCGQHTYYKIDEVLLFPTLYYWDYDPTIEREILALNQPTDGISYPYQDVYWSLSCLASYTHNLDLELVTKAYATTIPEIYENIAELEQIEFITLNDYNDQYKVGDNINELIGIISYNNDTMSTTKLINDWNQDDIPYLLTHHNPVYIYMKENPTTELEMSIQVIFKLEGDIFIHTISKPISIY